MDGLSLYDLLIGHFENEKINEDQTEAGNAKKNSDDGLALARFNSSMSDPDKLLQQSILDSLSRILQTRQNPNWHLPDFGVPDIIKLFAKSKNSGPVKKQIEKTILTYEPRIESLDIEEPKVDMENLRIEVKIKATIRDSKIMEIFLTEFSLTGWTKVDRL